MKQFLRKLAEPFMILYPLQNGNFLFHKHKLINTILGRKSKVYIVPKQKMRDFEMYGTLFCTSKYILEDVFEDVFHMELGLTFRITTSIMLLLILMYLFFIKNNEQF